MSKRKKKQPKEELVEQPQQEAPPEKRPWLCDECDKKLGEFDEENVLRIKRGPMRVTVSMTHGTVTVICPACGWSKIWDGTRGPVAVEGMEL